MQRAIGGEKERGERLQPGERGGLPQQPRIQPQPVRHKPDRPAGLRPRWRVGLEVDHAQAVLVGGEQVIVSGEQRVGDAATGHGILEHCPAK